MGREIRDLKQVGDTVYEFTPSFRRGAHDFWGGVSNHDNPYRAGTQAADEWDDGHVLASSGDVTRKEIGKAKRLVPAPSATRCNRCREKAVIRLSATDLQGTVLDTEIACRECAKEAGFEVGEVEGARGPSSRKRSRS